MNIPKFIKPRSRNLEVKEYAPSIFQRIRNIDNVNEAYIAEILKIEEENFYLKKILDNTKNTGGNSGSFFYFTPDKRFIIKSLDSEEKSILIGPFLNDYCDNLTFSLLSRIYGVFKLKIGNQYSVYLMIMGSIIPSDA